MVPVSGRKLVRMLSWGGVAARVALAAAALLLLAATALAFAGALPWPSLPLTYGRTPLPQAGMWLQIGLAAMTLCLSLGLSARARPARRGPPTALGVEDVARAYRIAHAADRTGVFTLAPEFDNLRSRMEHLRNHPDLGHLEPELLRLATQMSYETRDLARTFSDTKVERAREFLKQRQDDVQALTDALARARRICDDLRRTQTDIQTKEAKARADLRSLEADLRAILPALGYGFDPEGGADGNVVTLRKTKPRPKH